MAQEERHQEKLDKEHGSARNPEIMDAQEDTTNAPGRQETKGPWRQTTAISEGEEENRERHKWMELMTDSPSGKRRNTLQ
jgi:hypothetical protein